MRKMLKAGIVIAILSLLVSPNFLGVDNEPLVISEFKIISSVFSIIVLCCIMGYVLFKTNQSNNFLKSVRWLINGDDLNGTD